MIVKTYKNCLGTASIVAKFGGMRKEQDFCVYPIREQSDLISIQSSKYWGELNRKSGELELSASHNGANSMSFMLDKLRGKVSTIQLSAEELEQVLSAIRSTSSSMAGSNGIMYCDNSLAHAV